MKKYIYVALLLLHVADNFCSDLELALGDSSDFIGMTKEEFDAWVGDSKKLVIDEEVLEVPSNLKIHVPKVRHKKIKACVICGSKSPVHKNDTCLFLKENGFKRNKDNEWDCVWCPNKGFNGLVSIVIHVRRMHLGYYYNKPIKEKVPCIKKPKTSDLPRVIQSVTAFDSIDRSKFIVKK